MSVNSNLPWTNENSALDRAESCLRTVHRMNAKVPVSGASAVHSRSVSSSGTNR